MAVLFFIMLRHPPPLRPGAGRARRLGVLVRGPAAALAGARDRPGLQDPQADPARPGLRPRHPPLAARGDHRQRRAGRDQGAAGRVGPPRHPGAAEDPGLAVPRDHPPGRRLRQGRPARQPARRRHGLHPRVRRRRTGASSCCTTRARCGSRAGCCSPRVSWSPACRGSCARPRAPRPGSTAPRPGRCGGASEPQTRARGSATGGPARSPWSTPSSRRRSARSPTAATASPATTARWSSSATRCRASASGSRVTRGRAGDRFLLGDAVEVLEASPHRRPPPCPFSGPGRCGGCDWQHADLGYQRELKAAVVSEQLHRLAGLDLDVTVEPVPGDADGLRWRTRVEFAVDASGRAGLRRHHSHDVIRGRRLPRSPPSASPAPGVLERHWPKADAGGRRRRPPASPGRCDPGATTAGPPPATSCSGWTRGDWSGEFRLSARGFWQVHPGAAATFVAAVLEQLAPRAGERALDLYAGVGLFARGPRRRGRPRRRRPGGRVRRPGRARRRAQPRRPPPGRDPPRPRSTGRCDRCCARTSPPTSWCSTRRAPVPAGR